jgi:hypothetical protein
VLILGGPMDSQNSSSDLSLNMPGAMQVTTSSRSGSCTIQHRWNSSQMSRRPLAPCVSITHSEKARLCVSVVGGTTTGASGTSKSVCYSVPSGCLVVHPSVSGWSSILSDSRGDERSTPLVVLQKQRAENDAVSRIITTHPGIG